MTVKIEGLPALQRKLKNVSNFNQWAQKPMRETVDHLFEETQKQPAKQPGAFSAMATDGQRRAYWAKVRSGEARHGPSGYIRSKRLLHGWTKKILRSARGLSGRIENAIPYGRFVQGRNRQPFHRASGWLTDTQIAGRNSPQVMRFWAEAVEGLLRK